MGTAELRDIVAAADAVLEGKESIALQLLTEDHLTAIAAAHERLIRGEASTTTDPTVMDAARITQSNAIRLSEYVDQPYRRIITSLRHELDGQMLAFFDHDIAHIGDHLYGSMQDLSRLARSRGADSLQTVQRARSTNQLLPQIRDAYCYPWQMLRRMALNKLGEPQEYEHCSIDNIIMTTANILASRFDATVYSDKQAANIAEGEPSIIIESENQTIRADNGYLFSIMYNNLKNSLKKIDEQYNFRKRNEDHRKVSFTARATCSPLNEEFLMLTFSDSGSGIDINKMLERVSEAMTTGTHMTWPSQQLQDKFAHWKGNDYAFNLLTMEDATNVAFMAQLTGARTPSVLASGMGLYGTRYLVEELGGAVLYATTFNGQHPMFSYLIPREPQSNTMTAQAIRQQLINKAA